jgi:hypothetical protein
MNNVWNALSVNQTLFLKMLDIEHTEVALFKTSKYFSIVGIGKVLTGEIIDGEINSGNFFKVRIEDLEVTYIIDEVERVDYPLRNIVEIGLILEPVEPFIKVNLDSILGKTIAILSD